MSFIKRNIVLIVMLPVIGAIHYGWWQMKDNSDRKELPLISMFRLLGDRMTNSTPGKAPVPAITSPKE